MQISYSYKTSLKAKTNCKNKNKHLMKTHLRMKGFQCVKSVQKRTFFGSVFSCIRTEYGDSRKSPNLFRIQENTDHKKLCIWTLFTQCLWLQHKGQLIFMKHVFYVATFSSSNKSCESTISLIIFGTNSPYRVKCYLIGNLFEFFSAIARFWILEQRRGTRL